LVDIVLKWLLLTPFQCREAQLSAFTELWMYAFTLALLLFSVKGIHKEDENVRPRWIASLGFHRLSCILGFIDRKSPRIVTEMNVYCSSIILGLGKALERR
jgi:hypothetical protein